MAGKEGRGLLTTAGDFWLDHPSLDPVWAIGVGVIAAELGIGRFITVTDHSGFYQLAGAVSLGLLSLGSIAVTLVVSVTPSERLNRVLDEAGDHLLRLIFLCLGLLVLTTFSTMALFALDLPSLGYWRILAAVATSVVLLSSSARLFSVLYRVVKLML